MTTPGPVPPQGTVAAVSWSRPVTPGSKQSAFFASVVVGQGIVSAVRPPRPAGGVAKQSEFFGGSSWATGLAKATSAPMAATKVTIVISFMIETDQNVRDECLIVQREGLMSEVKKKEEWN